MLSKLLMLCAVLGLRETANAALIILDNFDSATGGVSVVGSLDVAQGCPGPTEGIHSGATVFGGTGTRWMTGLLAIDRTLGFVAPCGVRVAVDDGNSNRFEANAIASSRGLIDFRVKGATPVTLLPTTDYIQFEASSDVPTVIDLVLWLEDPFKLSGPANLLHGAFLLSSPSLTTYTLPATSLRFLTGTDPTVIQGYSLVVGFHGSVVIDNLRIASGPDVIPEPASATGVGAVLVGLLLVARRLTPTRS